MPRMIKDPRQWTTTIFARNISRISTPLSLLRNSRIRTRKKYATAPTIFNFCNLWYLFSSLDGGAYLNSILVLFCIWDIPDCCDSISGIVFWDCWCLFPPFSPRNPSPTTSCRAAPAPFFWTSFEDAGSNSISEQLCLTYYKLIS